MRLYETAAFSFAVMDAEPKRFRSLSENGLEPIETFLGTTHSFIVVIRQRSLSAGPGGAAWIGSAEQGQSRDRIYFVDLARLDEFIVSHSGIRLRPLSKLSRLCHWSASRFRSVLGFRISGKP